MKTYNTYQEAKIANPESLICKFGDKFTIDASRYGQALQPCNPADYCMSADEFRGRGHAFVDDDLVVNINGMVQSVKADFLNTVDSPLNLCIFVLRAAALENQMNIDNLATQTPEEKEALDLIDTTPHQYEMSKFSGNEWNGEGLPPVGSLCKVNRDSFTYRVMYSSEYVVIVQNLDNDNTTAHGMDIILDLHKGNYTFSKPESPQQREGRERLEAAYDLYCAWVGDRVGYHAIDFDKWKVEPDFLNKWLRIVDKTNYRKESN
jgi:hypothetical protein